MPTGRRSPPSTCRTRGAARKALSRSPGKRGNEQVLAKSLTYLGLLDQVTGELDEADRKLAEALKLATSRGFRDTVAQSNTWLGAHANWRGDFGRALTLCRQAERTAEEIHDGFQELFAIAFISQAQIGLGQYRDAVAVIDAGVAKARDRDNTYMVGRLHNTRGWLHQELGDFRNAAEFDREGVDLGQQAKNPNAEISALINLGLDYLHLGEPPRALALLEDTIGRVEKQAFGAHRWRSTIHLWVYLAETLLAIGRPEAALVHIENALRQARPTRSTKYVAKCHALRGQIALDVRQCRGGVGSPPSGIADPRAPMPDPCLAGRSSSRGSAGGTTEDRRGNNDGAACIGDYRAGRVRGARRYDEAGVLRLAARSAGDGGHRADPASMSGCDRGSSHSFRGTAEHFRHSYPARLPFYNKWPGWSC